MRFFLRLGLLLPWLRVRMPFKQFGLRNASSNLLIVIDSEPILDFNVQFFCAVVGSIAFNLVWDKHTSWKSSAHGDASRFVFARPCHRLHTQLKVFILCSWVSHCFQFSVWLNFLGAYIRLYTFLFFQLLLISYLDEHRSEILLRYLLGGFCRL